ncbi:MAG: outer membrane beta-barrel protein [candidate division Zixibacteria bacterium]
MKRISILIAGLLIVPMVSTVSAQTQLRFGIQSGPFMPQDWQVQGRSVIFNDPVPVQFVSVSGFGNGADLLLFAEYSGGNFGLRITGGIQLLKKYNYDIQTASGERHLENNLTIIPIVSNVIYRFESSNPKISPYFGFGPGLYIAKWEEKDFRYYSTFERDWFKGSKTAPGVNVLAGLEYVLYKGLRFGIEFSHSYVSADWRIDDEDSDSNIEYDNLNIGGSSIRLGLIYHFEYLN